MNHIIKYKMHKDNNNNLITPYFVKDGGYFEVNGEKVGISEDDDEVYLPKSVIIMPKEDFTLHVEAIAMVDPIPKETLDVKGEIVLEANIELTKEEKTTMATAWLKDRGM
jgi:hypothetical protein